MKVSDIMTHDVTVIHPEATLREACEKMRDIDSGFLPVCDGKKLRGTLTDRDIVVRGIAADYEPNESAVRDIMSDEVVYVFEDQDIEEAASLMEEKQIRRLVVLNRNKDMVGVVSLGDISTQQDDEELSGEILKRVSEPSGPDLGTISS
jgi:CBS domain-containing protein